MQGRCMLGRWGHGLECWEDMMLDSECSGQVDGTQALALHLVLAGLPCGKGVPLQSWQS